MKTFTTPKNTQLPIMSLKGKDYLQVAHRLVWFREELPKWRIETEFLQLTDKFAIAKATIRDDSGDIIATAHKREDAGHFGDFMEKAETGAIGRCLAYCGFGTQFCADELDEGERIADAPVTATKKITSITVAPKAQPETSQPKSSAVPPEDSGWDVFSKAVDDSHDAMKAKVAAYRVPFGKKHLGKSFAEMGLSEVESYSKYLRDDAERKGKRIEGPALDFLSFADWFIRLSVAS